MNEHNEYNLKPGTWRHYKTGLYVVFTMVTHMDNPATGKMELLADPLVVYRDLAPVMRHVDGKHIYAVQHYARPLSEFVATVEHNGTMVKRFEKI